MTTNTADVFVSYKAEDRPRVRPLVAALEAEGFSVWWDAHIGSGTNWRKDIQEHLDAAKCVIVAWTKLSVGEEGEFVRDEATRARRRGAYVPIRLDVVEPPLGFGEVQALSLKGWKGDRADPRFRQLVDAVQSRLTGEQQPHPHIHLPQPSVSRRTLVVGGAGAAVLAAAGGWFLLEPAAANAKRIAVLPFANLSGDEKQAYFSEGVAEELRSALARIDLEVIGRSSSEAVKDMDSKAAAEKLGVANILTGSVRRSPQTIRISAQLISGSDGVERWAQTYDRAPGDAIKIQSDIATKVAEELSATLGQARHAAVIVGGTSSGAAQDLYLRAKALVLSDGTEEACRRAVALLDAAIQVDPNYADALALKADTLIRSTGNYVSDQAEIAKGYAEADAAARRALSIAPQLPAGHVALAELAINRVDATDALAQYQLAVSEGAGNPAFLVPYARLLSELGRSGEALKIIDQAVALDPLAPRAYGIRGIVLFYGHRYSDAIGSAQRALQLAPTLIRTYQPIADCLVLLGRPKEALAAYARLAPDDPFRSVGAAIATAKLGDRAGAHRLLAMLIKDGGDAGSSQYAEIHAQLGEIDEAIASLSRAVEIRDPGIIAIRADPFLDPLRSDPRLGELQRRLNLP